MPANSAIGAYGLDLVVAAALAANAVFGVRTGKIGWFYSAVRKADNPRQFRLAVATCSFGAGFLLFMIVVSIVRRAVS